MPQCEIIFHFFHCPEERYPQFPPENEGDKPATFTGVISSGGIMCHLTLCEASFLEREPFLHLPMQHFALQFNMRPQHNFNTLTLMESEATSH